MRNLLDWNLLFLALAANYLLLPGAICHADSATISVAATVLSKSVCKFDSKNSSLNFGALDPGNPVDVAATASIGFVCRGSAPIASFNVMDDDGLHENGQDSHRMRHSSVMTEYLPYGLTLSPSSGTVPKNEAQSLWISGMIRGTDYPDAAAGSYSDTVVISILP